MSDEMMSGVEPTGPEGTVAPLPAAPAGGGGARKIVLIVVGVVVLLGILAAVAFVALGALSLFSSSTSTTTQLPPITAGTPAASSTVSPTASGTLAPIPVVTDRDIFTPRNPFEVIVPSIPATSSSSSNSDTSGTLTLTDIVTENGVRKAVVRLNGTSYKLAKGATVDSSSWSIVEVNKDNIVALYGDVRVTISLGQGSSK